MCTCGPLNTWMSVCQCYNISAVARAVAIGYSEVALQVNMSVVRAKKNQRVTPSKL